MPDTDQDKMDRLVAETRHDAIVKKHDDTIDSLNKMSKTFKEQNEQGIATIKNLIENQQKSVSEFASALKEFPKLLAPPKVNVEAPQINVETNQEKVITSITELGNKIAEGQASIDRALTELLNEVRMPKKWVFTPNREFDRIKSVTAEQQVMKPKYQA